MALRVAIVGAGAIGRAYAALASRAGHDVAMWSPRGGSPPQLAYDGIIEGQCAIRPIQDPASIGDGDVVLVAIPGTAYSDVIPRMAPHVRSSQVVFVSGALSLAPLWLAELAATH